jgi:DNA-binding transcriptional LysR family regulator
MTVNTQMVHELTACLGDFVARHPKITVELVHFNRLVDLVAERVDVALCLAPLSDNYSSQVVRLLAPGRRIACASPEYLKRYGTPTEPDDLHEHSCIVSVTREAPLDNWEFTDTNDRHAKPNVVKVNGVLVRVRLLIESLVAEFNGTR